MLRDHYTESMSMSWKVGDAFVCTVKEYDPDSEEYKMVPYAGKIEDITVKEEHEVSECSVKFSVV